MQTVLIRDDTKQSKHCYNYNCRSSGPLINFTNSELCEMDNCQELDIFPHCGKPVCKCEGYCRLQSIEEKIYKVNIVFSFVYCNYGTGVANMFGENGTELGTIIDYVFFKLLPQFGFLYSCKYRICHLSGENEISIKQTLNEKRVAMK